MSKLIFFVCTLLSTSAFALPDSAFTCAGTAVENKQVRKIAVTAPFAPADTETSLSELQLGFRHSATLRMNLQLRALARGNDLEVAATFLTVALEPLGRVESVFHERLHPEDGRFVLVKDFGELQLKLACHRE